MLRHLTFSCFLFVLTETSFGQILCIQCYNQNNPVSTNITNLITNGSFENSTCTYPGYFCPSSLLYNCDIQNWQCTGGGTGTYAYLRNATAGLVVDGMYAAYFGNLYCMACGQVADDTTCLVDSGCIVNGIPNGYPLNFPSYGGSAGVALEQTVSGLTPGTVYVLEFWTGGEEGFPNDGIFAVDIGFGKTFLRNPMTNPTDIGRRFIIQFLADSSTHTIRFTNWGHISNVNTELVMDDIRLYPISQLSSIIPACAVGINAAGNSPQVSMHMNETDNTLEVYLVSPGKYFLSIYNQLGQQLIQKSFSKNFTVDTRLLRKGIYVCMITGNGIKYTDKITIN